jgi:hypothetical protein
MDIVLSLVDVTPVLPGSKWNAVRNPMTYVLQRKDFEFDDIVNLGAFCQFIFDGVDLTSELQVGDTIYYKTNPTLNNSGTYTITASTFTAGQTKVTTNQAFVAGSNGGFMNNVSRRSGYYVAVNVFFAGSSNSYINDEPLIFTPDSTGRIVIDIAAVCAAQLSAENSANFANLLWSGTPHHYDAEVFKQFGIKYQENWTGSSESFTEDIDTVFGVLAGLQIPATYGGNMFQYTSLYDVNTGDGIGYMIVGSTLIVGAGGGSIVGNWLTLLDTLVMWRGYPFTLSCIIAETLTELSKFVVTPQGFAAQESTPAVLAASIRQLALTDVNNLADAESIAVELKTYDGVSAYTTTMSSINVEVRDAGCNGIMLLGRNRLGGPLWWLFEYSQEYEYTYNNGRKAKRMTLTAVNVTANQWEALQDFISLGDVYNNSFQVFDSSINKTASVVGQQLYIVEPDGSKIGVIPIKSNNVTRTRRALHNFTLTIELPHLF